MAVWDGSTLEVATALVGSQLLTESPAGLASVTITETEAYGGSDDPASHAYRTRTDRNTPMFGRAGTVYVYRSYGLHWCLNVVTGAVDDPGAVLIRAGVPLEGRQLMTDRRGRADHLADGPGKLTAALGIDGSLDGRHLQDLSSNEPSIGGIRLSIIPRNTPVTVAWKPRVGLTKAVDRAWRCVLVKD